MKYILLAFTLTTAVIAADTKKQDPKSAPTQAQVDALQKENLDLKQQLKTAYAIETELQKQRNTDEDYIVILRAQLANAQSLSDIPAPQPLK